MGWWRISGPSGHINWSAGYNGENATLFNCIPGRDDPMQMYSGDEPADILDAAVKQIEAELHDDAYRAAVRAVFLRQPGAHKEHEEIPAATKEMLKNAKKQIEDVYQREWNRAPTPAELSAVFEFCTSFLKFDRSQ
jgi:hypothetical protein